MGDLAVRYMEPNSLDLHNSALVYSTKQVHIDSPSAEFCSSIANRREITYVLFPNSQRSEEEVSRVEKARIENTDDDAQRWVSYLSKLHQAPVGLDSNFAHKVAIVWWKLASNSGTNISPPAAGPSDELGFQFVWNRTEYYLEIEIAKDGQFEWFFTDKRTGETLGTEEGESLNTPNEALIRSLVRVSAGNE